MLNEIGNMLRRLSQCHPLDIAMKLISRDALIKIVNVILRVPALFIAEVWLRTDPQTISLPVLHNKINKDLVDKAIHSMKTHDFAVYAAYYSGKIQLRNAVGS